MRAAVRIPDHELVSSLLWHWQTTGIAEVHSDRGPAWMELLAGFATREATEAAAAAVRPHSADVRIGPADATGWFDPARRATLDLDGQQLEIEVGPAFGDGHHPTTRLALDLLGSTVGAGDRVLDFGTGTGVLALAALAAGAAAVLAVDDDPAALGVARRNLHRHRHRHRGPSPAAPVQLSERLPASTGATFDVVVANVLLPVHRQWAPDLKRRLGAGGAVIASGVIDSQANDLLAAYQPLTEVARATIDDWLGVVLR